MKKISLQKTIVIIVLFVIIVKENMKNLRIF